MTTQTLLALVLFIGVRAIAQIADAYARWLTARAQAELLRARALAPAGAAQ